MAGLHGSSTLAQSISLIRSTGIVFAKIERPSGIRYLRSWYTASTRVIEKLKKRYRSSTDKFYRASGEFLRMIAMVKYPGQSSITLGGTTPTFHALFIS